MKKTIKPIETPPLIQFVNDHASLILDLNPEISNDTEPNRKKKRVKNNLKVKHFLEEFTNRYLTTSDKPEQTVILAIFEMRSLQLITD
jgi:hypothetical protein